MAVRNKLNASILRDILPQNLSKSDLRRLEILNGAIKTYAQVDSQYIGYEDVGREAKTSSALIQHYFPNKAELLLTAMKLVRGQFQELVIQMMAGEKTPTLIMEKYVRGTFQWLQVTPAHAKAWFFFLCLCSSDEKLRAAHLDLTTMGQSRIAEILRMGLSTGEFNFTIAPEILAKHIQKLITGGLLEVTSESGIRELKRIENETWVFCQGILKSD